MNTLLAQVIEDGGTALFAGFIVFLRIGGFMAVLPAFGEQSVPPRIRLVLAFCFTLVAAPAVTAAVTPLAESGRVVALYLLTEPVIGLAIGLVLRLFVLALQVAGTIIAQSTSLVQLFGGTGAEPLPAIGNLLTVAGLALAVMAGLHVRLTELMILSYELLPPGVLPQGAAALAWGLGNVARAFALAFSLAAPFVIAALVYNVALGAINRAMPQLMVAFVGAPGLTLGGLALMALVVPAMLAMWLGVFNAFMASPFAAIP